jgi:hypothetical protein
MPPRLYCARHLPQRRTEGIAAASSSRDDTQDFTGGGSRPCVHCRQRFIPYAWYSHANPLALAFAHHSCMDLPKSF